MADPKAPPKPRKVIDVTEPGKTAPPSSAKPIIVTNRPVLRQDPMMAPASTPAPDGLEADKPVSRVARPITIAVPADIEAPAPKPVPGIPPKPIVAPLAPQIPSAPMIDGLRSLKPDAPATASVQPAKDPIPTPEPAAPTLSEPKEPGAFPAPADTAKKDEAATPTPAAASSAPEETDDAEPDDDKQLAPNKALEDAKKKEEERKAAIAAEQEKIIESKQYYLPVSAEAGRPSTRLALVLLLLVLLGVIVWLDVMLDAGIVRINGVHALTHFFQS